MSAIRFQQIIQTHISRYPLSQAEDIYKLCHQASLGSEHAVKDSAAAREWLLRELSELGDPTPEQLLDEISADGAICRVHLYPYVVSGRDPEKLLEAFIQTAQNFKGSTSQLRRYMAAIVEMAQNSEIPVKAEEVKSLSDEMQAEGFPPIHHSPIYVQAYNPHYRVIARQFLLHDLGLSRDIP